jgi:hypothetical protein
MENRTLDFATDCAAPCSFHSLPRILVEEDRLASICDFTSCFPACLSPSYHEVVATSAPMVTGSPLSCSCGQPVQAFHSSCIKASSVMSDLLREPSPSACSPFDGARPHAPAKAASIVRNQPLSKTLHSGFAFVSRSLSALPSTSVAHGSWGLHDEIMSGH